MKSKFMLLSGKICCNKKNEKKHLVRKTVTTNHSQVKTKPATELMLNHLLLPTHPLYKVRYLQTKKPQQKKKVIE